MKILHALVAHLAVYALPFQPFAFASPLAAIDYEGCVNTTQNHIDGAVMKHVLGSTVETCQTVTMQNHKDSALIKPVPGDIIEARQGEDAIPIAFIIIGIAVEVSFILDWIADDNMVSGNDVLEFLVEHFD